MTTAVHIMGPHAIESYRSRNLALASFGIDATAVALYRYQEHILAKESQNTRALMVQEEHHLMGI